MKPSYLAIYALLAAASMLLLLWCAKAAIKNIAERYRDPLGRFEYGERHSDWDGDK